MSKTHRSNKPSIPQRRMHIIGQCNGSDFDYLDHLVLESTRPNFVLDAEHLKKKHVFAFSFLRMCHDKGINLKLIKEVVQEVLYWGYEDEKSEKIEIRLIRDEKLIPLITLFRTLWDTRKPAGAFPLPKKDLDGDEYRHTGDLDEL